MGPVVCFRRIGERDRSDAVGDDAVENRALRSARRAVHSLVMDLGGGGTADPSCAATVAAAEEGHGLAYGLPVGPAVGGEIQREHLLGGLMQGRGE